MQNQEILNISKQSFELSSDLVLFLDDSLSITWHNSEFTSFQEQHHIKELTSFVPYNLLQKAVDSQQEVHEFDFDFHLLQFHAKFSPIKGSDHYVLICDNAKLQQLKQSLYELMYTDPITGGGNLFRNEIIVNEFYQQRLKNPRLKMLLMAIDFEDFEKIDFFHSHETGHNVLKNFSEQLVSLENNSTVCRTSGNCLLATCIFEEDNFDIDNYTKRVIDIFNKPITIDDDTSVFVSTIIGVVVLPDDGKDRHEAIKNVTLAQQESKKYYDKVSLVFYQHSLGHANDHMFNIEQKLEEAIDNEYLELYYQPKVDVNNKKIYGFEALLRWHDPELGFISPADFIPIAESTGKIVPIGLWVFEQVCKQINTWHTQGFDFKVSLNVSVRQLHDSNFINSFKKVLDETKVNTSLIELEITESILSEELHIITQLFKQIKDLGLSISLDDFGTKYSSLSYLTNLPVDILKIDRTFIKDSCTNVKDAAIAKTIVILAKELELKVVAEGVEDQEQVNLLEDMECDYIQGFYYYKPMCVRDIDALLIL